MSIFKQLKEMHDKFGIKRNLTPNLLPVDHMNFRLDFLDEELLETKEAYVEGDLEEVIDGLIDLIIVVAGTLDLMGVDSQRHFDEVQRANLSKRVVKDPTKSKRGFAIDLEKPFNWVGPNHKIILDGSDEES